MYEQTWVLAFDAECSTCREISEVVREAGAAKLDVLPLAHPDVRKWRATALSPDAIESHAPTLIRTQDDDVRAWTGLAMAIPLLRRLGLRNGFNVLQALGQLRFETRHPAYSRQAPAGRNRRNFLRIGAGAVVAGVILSGATPSFADDRRRTASHWVSANEGNLARAYDEFITFNQELRRTIYRELPQSKRSRLWVEHIERFRDSLPTITDDQSVVLERALEIAGDEPTFIQGRLRTEIGAQESAELKNDAVAAFGQEGAFLLLASIGPAPQPGDIVPLDDDRNDCTCSEESDYCFENRYCKKDDGCNSYVGCGTFWEYTCNGYCFN